MFKLARKHGHLSRIPDFEGVMFPEPPPRQRVISHEEYQRLRAHVPNEHWRDLLDFQFWTGWRTGQITSLTWDDLDAATLTLRVPEAMTKGGMRHIFDARALPETERVLRARLKARRPGCPYVFHDKGHPMSWHRRWRTLCKAAELKAGRKGEGGITPHDFRRGATGLLLDAGVDVRTVTKWVGWKSPRMISRYDQRTTSARLGPRSSASWKRVRRPRPHASRPRRAESPPLPAPPKAETGLTGGDG